MADDREIRDRIKQLIVDRLGFEGLAPSEIEDHAPFNALGLDSVDALELVVCLEKDFGIKVRNEDLRKESFASIAVLAALIDRYRAAAKEV